MARSRSATRRWAWPMRVSVGAVSSHMKDSLFFILLFQEGQNQPFGEPFEKSDLDLRRRSALHMQLYRAFLIIVFGCRNGQSVQGTDVQVNVAKLRVG